MTAPEVAPGDLPTGDFALRRGAPGACPAASAETTGSADCAICSIGRVLCMRKLEGPVRIVVGKAVQQVSISRGIANTNCHKLLTECEVL